MSSGSTASCAMHHTAEGSASTISGVAPRAGSRMTMPLAVPMQRRIAENRSAKMREETGGSGTLGTLLVKPCAGFTLPRQGTALHPVIRERNVEDDLSH